MNNHLKTYKIAFRREVLTPSNEIQIDLNFLITKFSAIPFDFDNLLITL